MAMQVLEAMNRIKELEKENQDLKKRLAKTERSQKGCRVAIAVLVKHITRNTPDNFLAFKSDEIAEVCADDLRIVVTEDGFIFQIVK